MSLRCLVIPFVVILVVVVPIAILALLFWWLSGKEEPETVISTSTDAAPVVEPPAVAEAPPEPEPAPVLDEVEAPALREVEVPVLDEVEAPVLDEVEAPALREVEAPVVTEAEVSFAAPAPDNLKRIEGIGPKVANLLGEAGILTFKQLAAADLGALQAILDEAGLQFMNPTSWPQQAGLAAKGDWEALEKLQDELKGGRQS